MSFIRGVIGLFSKIATGLISAEIREKARQVEELERDLARDLARQLRVPSDAVVVTSLPIPRVELKVAVSAAQLLKVEQFLDKLRGTPRVNVRVRPGMH